MPNKTATIIPQVRGTLSVPYPQLASAVIAVSRKVCEAHIDEVRAAFPQAAYFDDDAALDDLPHVLDGLANVFWQPEALASFALLGPAHATARDGQGFTLGEVFGEYVLLRRSLAKHLVAHLQRPLDGVEHEALQSSMDGLLAATLMSFVAQRDDRLRIETTALGNFLSSLAHDLRNEINGVITSMRSIEEQSHETQNALNQLAPADQALATGHIGALMQEITGSRTAMESTITAMTQLLQAERLRNRVNVRRRDVAMLKLMESAARSAIRSDHGSGPSGRRIPGQRVHVICPENLVVWTDPDLLGSVLVNLIGNAVRHAPEGDIHFVATPASDGRCRLEVRDEGPGIPEDKIEKLFDKFERGQRSEAGGLGLGLFIARRAAELLGGTITVDSKLGEGSCFVIELPGKSEDPTAR